MDDAGDLYIADMFNARIREVNTSGTITTVAGGLQGPVGVAFDAAGNFYIADYFASLVFKVETNGIITTVAGDRNVRVLRERRAGHQSHLELP